MKYSRDRKNARASAMRTNPILRSTSKQTFACRFERSHRMPFRQTSRITRPPFTGRPRPGRCRGCPGCRRRRRSCGPCTFASSAVRLMKLRARDSDRQTSRRRPRRNIQAPLGAARPCKYASPAGTLISVFSFLPVGQARNIANRLFQDAGTLAHLDQTDIISIVKVALFARDHLEI